MDFECQFVCELSELSPEPALVIRTRTVMSGVGSLLDEGFREIAALLREQGFVPSGAPFARYANMEMSAVDVEFGIPAPATVVGRGRVIMGSTPSGKAASAIFIGPYSEIGPAYDALLKWAGDNGFSPSGEACEFYLTDPATTPADQLRTRACLMLRDA